MSTWKDNAEAFADLDNGEGWEFARLAACSVKPGEGDRSVSCRDRDTNGKTSAREFAKAAKTSADRVMRFYTAWDAAAAAGWCVHSDDLTPDDATLTPLPDVPWKQRNARGHTVMAGGLYDSSSGAGRTVDTTRKDAIRAQAQADGTGASKAVDIASNPKALAAAIKADPATAAAARKALMAKDDHDRGSKPDPAPGGNYAPDPIRQGIGRLAATVAVSALDEFIKTVRGINQDGALIDGATLEMWRDRLKQAADEVAVAAHRLEVSAL